MNGNDFIKFILRSPFHKMMSASTMLITVTGRKTGRPITTPVNYYQEGDTLWVLTVRGRKWWRNVQNGAGVDLLLRGKQQHAHAGTILEEGAVAAQIGEYVRHIPLSARSLGIRIEQGIPNPADLARVARERLMVRLKLV